MIIRFDPRIVRDNPYQPRQHYDESELDELAGSLKDQGLIQKPTARLIDGQGAPRHITDLTRAAHKVDKARFAKDAADTETLSKAFDILHHTQEWNVEICVGHRRLRAWKRAFSEPQMEGFDHIELDVDYRTNEQMATVAHAENDERFRKGITPIDEALFMQRLMEDFRWTQKEVAKKLGYKRPTVTNKLRLLKLPQDVQKLTSEGTISERTAQALYPAFTLSEEDQAIVGEFESWQKTPEKIVELAASGHPSTTVRLMVENLIDSIAQLKAKKQREAEARKKLEELGGDANGIPHKRTLPHGAYEDVSDDKKNHRYVAGCSSECECRLQVIGYDGGLDFVCSNPSRHRGLKSKATKDRKAKARETVAESIAALYETIVSGDVVNWNPALIRLIVWNGLSGPNASDIREALDDLVGVGLLTEQQRKDLDGLAVSYHLEKGRALDALSSVDMHTALLIVAGSAIRNEMRDHVEFGGKLTDWKRVMKAEPYDPETVQAQQARAAGRHVFSATEIRAVAKRDSVATGDWWKDPEDVSPEYAALVTRLNALTPWLGIMRVSEIDPGYGPPAVEGLPDLLNDITAREKEVEPKSVEAHRLGVLQKAAGQVYVQLFERFGEATEA